MIRFGNKYSLEVSVDNSTWTSIPDMVSLTMPTISKDNIETTNHDSEGNRTFVGGLVDNGEVVFTSRSELYTTGEGYGNWNPQLANGNPSQNRSTVTLDGHTYTTTTANKLTSIHTNKDYKTAFPYEEININGTFRNTKVSNAGTGILRSDVSVAHKGTGWTTDGSSTNAGVTIDHTTTPKRIVVDASNDENPPHAYMNKAKIAKDSGTGTTGLDVFRKTGEKYQFEYTVHSFSPENNERFLILNYGKSTANGGYLNSGTAGMRIPRSVGDHKVAFMSGGQPALSMFVNNTDISMSGLKLYRFFSWWDLMKEDTNLYGRIKNNDNEVESTFDCCVYGQEQSVPIDDYVETTVSLKIKGAVTYVN